MKNTAVSPLELKVDLLLNGSLSDYVEEVFFREELNMVQITKWHDELSNTLAEHNIFTDCVEHFGGEGQGDTYYSVYKFTDTSTKEKVFVKFEGSYASYCGSEFNSWFFVTPKEKTIVVYE